MTAIVLSAPAAAGTGTAQPPATTPVRRRLIDALRRAARRQWADLCRQAERPTRRVPYC